MANHPFKVNVVTKDGSTFSHFTSSFARDGETLISSSVMVDKINSIPQVSPFIESDESDGLSVVSSKNFGNKGATYISASYTHPNTGSVIFTDTETDTDGGLDYYTFYGSKVCSVLGLPEGVPIYTENFKLSDDSNDPDNYIAGDVIANSLTVKEGFKMSSQARVRGNMIFDHAFGEGGLLFASASTVEGSLGFNGSDDATRLNIGHITASGVYGVRAYFNRIYPASTGMHDRGLFIHFENTDDRLTIRDGNSPKFFVRSEQTRVLSSEFRVDNHATILGGVHVGGITDPGNDNLIVDGTITAQNIGSGEDDSVVILDSDGTLRTDEIDTRVWGTTLLDGTNGTNNEIAVFTDENSVEGDADFTWDGSTLQIDSSTSGYPRFIINNTNSNSSGPQLILQKSTTSEGDNDTCGNIIFQSNNDGNSLHSICRIQAIVRDVSSGTEDGEMIFYAHVAGTETDILTLADGTGDSSYFSGVLGVGSSVGTGTLYVRPTTNQASSLATAVNRGISINSFSDMNGSSNKHMTPIVWRSNDSDLTEAYKNIAMIGVETGFHGTNQNRASMVFRTADDETGTGKEHFKIRYDGLLSGTYTSIASNSDIRTKTNIVDYTGPTTGSMSGSTSLELIESLNMKHFEYNGDYGSIKGKKRVGVIAQEVTGSVPYIVTSDTHQIDENWYTDDVAGGKLKVDPTGSLTEIYNVALGDLVPDMINAIKDLSQQVKTLRAQISGSG